MAVFGTGADTIAQLLITAGDNPERLRSEAAFAALTGTCPVPASSGKTNRHRLNRAGDRQANSALYRITIAAIRYDQSTRDYLDRRIAVSPYRRIAEGKTKLEAIRCIKRYIVRQLYPIILVTLQPAK